MSKGFEGLKLAYRRVDPQLRNLEEENERLKKIVARQTLEIEFKSEFGETPIEVPRDREASFDPILVPKQSRYATGVKNLIVSLY